MNTLGLTTGPDHRLLCAAASPLALVLLGCAALFALGLYLLPNTPPPCGRWITGPQATPDMRAIQQQTRAACANKGSL